MGWGKASPSNLKNDAPVPTSTSRTSISPSTNKDHQILHHASLPGGCNVKGGVINHADSGLSVWGLYTISLYYVAPYKPRSWQQCCLSASEPCKQSMDPIGLFKISQEIIPCLKNHTFRRQLLGNSPALLLEATFFERAEMRQEFS